MIGSMFRHSRRVLKVTLRHSKLNHFKVSVPTLYHPSFSYHCQKETSCGQTLSIHSKHTIPIEPKFKENLEIKLNVNGAHFKKETEVNEPLDSHSETLEINASSSRVSMRSETADVSLTQDVTVKSETDISGTWGCMEGNSYENAVIETICGIPILETVNIGKHCMEGNSQKATAATVGMMASIGAKVIAVSTLTTTTTVTTGFWFWTTTTTTIVAPPLAVLVPLGFAASWAAKKMLEEL
eukprot:450338_1